MQFLIIGGDLDWFLFETKMRSLVREILDPVIDKNEIEAEKYMALERKSMQMQKRLENLEFAILNE